MYGLPGSHCTLLSASYSSPVWLYIVWSSEQLKLPTTWSKALYDSIDLVWFMASCTHLDVENMQTLT